MNQRGNEPMPMVHTRLPEELIDWIDSSAKEARVTRSEFIRQALEFLKESKAPIHRNIFRSDSE